MFGIPAFAATPFASQAGNSYSFSVAENIGAADSSTQAQVLLNTITENITVTQVGNDAGGNFFGSLTEGITLGDSSTQQFAFLQTFTNGVTQADGPTIAAQFAVSRAEPITIASDVAIYNAFLFSIVEDFGPSTALTIIRVFTDSVSEAITMADANSSTSDHPATVTENMSMADNQVIAGWMKISTTQSVTWTNVETSQ